MKLKTKFRKASKAQFLKNIPGKDPIGKAPKSKRDAQPADVAPAGAPERASKIDTDDS